MAILITGSKGCSGTALASLFNIQGSEQIYYTDLIDIATPNYFCCDLTKLSSTLDLLKKIKPQQIFHLAGTFTNDFEKDFQANVVTTRNLLQSIIDLALDTRVLLVGSAAEYGMIEQGFNPVKEIHPLNPTTNYGLTKVYQTELMKFYVRSQGLDVVMARTFNIKAKNLSKRLFIGRLYEQINALRAGAISKIRTGNLSAGRDYLDVSEVVRAYCRIMQAGGQGEIYNVGSGDLTKMSDLLNEILISEAIDHNHVISEDIDVSKTSTVSNVYADISKLKSLG